jgi:hypothetical protein
MDGDERPAVAEKIMRVTADVHAAPTAKAWK